MTRFFNRWNVNVRSAYFRILISTMAVTVIPLLLIYLLISVQTVRTIEQQSQAIDSQFLSKTQENVEQTLSRIQQDAITLADSRDTVSFVLLPEISDWKILQRLGADLSNISTGNSLISSAYIYSAYQGKVMTSDYRYYSLEEFYDQGWLPIYHRETAPAYWTEPRTVENIHGKISTCISLIIHVPSGSRKLSGAVILNLDTSDLDTMLLSGGTHSNGSVEILDQDLCSIGGESETMGLLQKIDTSWFASGAKGSQTCRINGESYLLSYTYSSLLGWYFIRTSDLTASFTGYRSIGTLLILFCLTLLLACFFAVRVSRSLYRPVKKLVEDMTGTMLNKGGLADEYGTIQAEYSRMQTKTTALESEITELQPLIRERFFLRLLHGQAEAPERELEQFGFGATAFAVFIVRCVSTKHPADGNSDLRYFRIRTQIEDILQSNALRYACVETSGDTIATLIDFKESFSPTDARRTLLSLSKFTRETLANDLHIDTVTGFSPLCRSAGEIPGAYTVAMKSVRFKLFQESDDVVQEDDELFAPYASLLQELLEQLAAGDGKYVRAAVDELFRAIRQNLEFLSQFQIQQIATKILNSIIELLIRNKLKTEQVFGERRNLFMELRQRDDLPAICQWMEAVCLRAAEELSQVNAKQTNQKIYRIQEYIEQHIGEDISLNDVATWVGLSPAYVSRTFKESTGQNFVEYLSVCRVEQAKELLENTQLSIKEIGFKSGFNSMQTFIRTFKKLEGCTPSQYRDKE